MMAFPGTTDFSAMSCLRVYVVCNLEKLDPRPHDPALLRGFPHAEDGPPPPGLHPYTSLFCDALMSFA